MVWSTTRIVKQPKSSCVEDCTSTVNWYDPLALPKVQIPTNSNSIVTHTDFTGCCPSSHWETKKKWPGNLLWSLPFECYPYTGSKQELFQQDFLLAMLLCRLCRVCRVYGAWIPTLPINYDKNNHAIAIFFLLWKKKTTHSTRQGY